MRLKLVPAMLALCAAAVPAMAATPYQANLADTVCNGETACKLAFPAVAAAETLTIQHISCSVTTSGEQGGVNTLLLTSTKAPATIDFIPAGQLLDGTNIRAIANLATLFTVKAGDRPEVSVAGNSTIVSQPKDGCFISGTETPQYQGRKS